MPKRGYSIRSGRGLACAAIVAALSGLVAAAANATPVQLANAQYSYEIDTPLATDQPTTTITQSHLPISPELINMPVPLSAVVAGDGTFSGSYGIFAASDRDTIHATFQVEGPGLFTGGQEAAILTLSASTSYQVTVNVKPNRIPPPTIKAVPVLALATGSVMCGGAAQVAAADVSVDFLTPLVNPAFASCGSQNPVQIPSFESQLSGLFQIGVPSNVVMAVSGALGLQAIDAGTDVGSFNATVDPTIEIDPSFAYADDFELDFSPGVTGVTSNDVPEPSSLALLAAMFTSFAIARRRKPAG
jgi:hypothetical protein